jgi:hypothetical protein
MSDREEQALSAIFAALDLAIEGKISAKETLNSLERVLDSSLEDNVKDLDGWEHAEKKAGILFEQCDQDLEFTSKVKWYNVECLISSTKLLSKIRLKLSTRGSCFDAISRWFATSIYECNVIFRFSVDGPVHEKQAVFLKEILKATKRDFSFLCSSFERREDTKNKGGNGIFNKSLELLSIIGINSETLKLLKPDPTFITFIPKWRDYKGVLDLLDGFLASQLSLEITPVEGLGELLISVFLFRKYQARTLAKDSINELATVDLLIKACDRLIISGENSDSSSEAFNLYKVFLNSLNPYEVNLGDRLECLHKIKIGDFKELLKYKQSLNLSNPADILFDLLIDLFRMSLPTTHAAPSVAVLLHKLSTPGVSQFLTEDLMASCRQYFEGVNSFAYLLFLHASISYNPQLIGLFLHSVADWATIIRERVRGQEISLTHIKEFFSQVGLRKVESMIIRDGRVVLTEQKAIFLKCCYLCFYLAKLVDDRQEASFCLQTMFKLADGVDNLWTITEESGIFFLDILEVLLPVTTFSNQDSHCMDVEGAGAIEESKTILNFIRLLSQKKESDSPRVCAFKSLLNLKLEIHQHDKMESSELSNGFDLIFKYLSFEEIFTSLRTELSEPALYYTFFFQTIASYLQKGVDDTNIVRSILNLMTYLYEELLLSSPDQLKSSAFTVFPLLCEKILPMVEDIMDRKIGERLSIHLFNIWIDQRDFFLIELAFKAGGQMKSTQKSLIACYLFELIKRKEYQNMPQSFFTLASEWLNSELASSKDGLLSAVSPRIAKNSKQTQTTSKKIDKELDDLDILEEEFQRDKRKDLFPTVEISRSQLIYMRVINSYYQNPEEGSSNFANFLSKEGNKLSEDDFAVLVYATETLPDKNLHSQLLRHYLSRMLSLGESSTAKLLEIYQSLLGSTDTVRELKTYLIQMEGVIEMANPLDKMISPQEVKSLILQLAKVKADFQSLSEQISRVANSIEKKWAILCSSIKGVERMLMYIKEGQSST